MSNIVTNSAQFKVSVEASLSRAAPAQLQCTPSFFTQCPCSAHMSLLNSISLIWFLPNRCLVGLSKERPILGHHAKAHILKSSRFDEIHPKPYKIRCFNKNSSVWGVQGGGYDPGFHEILVHSPSSAFIKLNSFG